MAGIARAAGVDRAFFYRHRDLLAQLRAWKPPRPWPATATGRACPGHPCRPTCLPPENAPPGSTAGSVSSRNAYPKPLGEQAWRESGLGTPADIDAVNQKIIHLEQQAIDLRLQLEEQGDELSAARATNRELMTQLNHASRPR